MTTARFTLACVANALFLILQAMLLVALGKGMAQEFQHIYRSFSAPQTSFSVFFLANYSAWWLAFAICLVAACTGAWRRSAPVLWWTLALSVLSLLRMVAALYGGIFKLGPAV